MLKRRWELLSPAPPSVLARLASDYTPLEAQILFNRGLDTPEAARTFLHGGVVPSNPFQMCGMDTAVERLLLAMDRGEKIAVYGDFDADGVCATALLTETLKAHGANAIPYIPHRINEGYGLNVDALKDLQDKGVRVVVTVDCGIRSLPEVQAGTQLGLDMIVTDHHSVGRELPAAVAVVNPKQPGDPYPFKELAGVGIAYKVAEALSLAHTARTPANSEWNTDALLDLVALGTVADLVALTGENRTLVQRGLQRLAKTERPGLQAMLAQMGLRGRRVDAGAISFYLGPRLNAAGRIEHARTAYKLLTVQYPGEADALAQQLEATNRDRQKLTDEMVTRAREMMTALPPGELILIAGSADFPEGIIGLIASKLQEEAYRPAIAITYQAEGKMRGSARSIPEFNIISALDECTELLVRHGGHAAAAGFTVLNDNYDALHARLRAIAERELASKELLPTIKIDAEASLGEMNWKLLEFLDKLAPFGYENRHPVLLARDVMVRYARVVGTDHLSLIVSDGVAVWDAIAFRQKDKFAELGELPRKADLVFTLASKQWNGENRLQLEVKDMRVVQQ